MADYYGSNYYPTPGGGYGGSDPYSSWLNSPAGQDWNRAKEAEAAYARKQADFEMAMKKKDLDLRVASLKQQGKHQEAQLELQRGQAQLARERFAWEQKIKAEEMALQRAEAYTKWSSTPDLYWSQVDFRGALSRAMSGLSPQSVAATVKDTGGPQMKTPSQFDAIAGPNGSLANANGGGQASPAMPSVTAGGAGATMDIRGGASPDSGGTAATDPRATAAAAVMRALPPSSETGMDENDMAALRAVESIYLAGKPGTLERLGPARRKIAQAGLARLGFDPALMEEDYRRGLPGQGSPLRAA